MSYVQYHPVFLSLHGKKILIVGGGNVAMEKLASFLESGALITVVSPEATEQIRDWHAEGRLVWIPEKFDPDQIEGFFMLIAATDDPEVNALVFKTGDDRHLLSNSVDDPINCNFIMAAITRQGPMQVAVSSAGCSPALAQRLRGRIAHDLLSEKVGRLAEFLGDHRPLIKRSLGGYKERQRFWESVIDSPIPDTLENQGWNAADAEFQVHLELFQEGQSGKAGKVTLVGAGPGDPELITLKAAKALRSADVVLYDRLVNPEILKECKSSALLIDVGKSPGECGRPRQETINALMIEHARAGHDVVRLKGGDPFVFGRGGEEILALREAEVAYTVVPGISSSIAAAGAAEIPVTHRGLATGFAVFTAQGATQEVDTVPWESLKGMPTIVLLMGVDQLPAIVQRMRAEGWDELTRMAVISHATLPTEQRAIGTLSEIQDLACHLPSPATIVIGEVASLGKVISGYKVSSSEKPQLLNA